MTKMQSTKRDEIKRQVFFCFKVVIFMFSLLILKTIIHNSKKKQ
jgi:hypothetical protein